jgi:hypothetical protein
MSSALFMTKRPSTNPPSRRLPTPVRIVRRAGVLILLPLLYPVAAAVGLAVNTIGLLLDSLTVQPIAVTEAVHERERV